MSTRTSYHHGDLAQALLRSLEEIIGERGAAHVSLRETARRANVSHSAPAHHFGDLDGMLDAFAAEGFDMLNEAIANAIAEVDDASDTDPVDFLVAVGTTYLRFAIGHPAHYEVMFRSRAPEDLEQFDEGLVGVKAAATFGPLAVGVGELVAAGRIEPGNGRYAASMLWGMVHGMASLWIDGKLPRFYEDHTVDEFVGGVMETMRRLLTGAGAQTGASAG